MPKTYIITEENTAEIRAKMANETNANLYRRMQAVALRGEGMSNAESGAIVKYHEKYVSQLVSLYVNKGLAALSEEGRKGGNHRNMSAEQENELLEGYRQEAEDGKIITPAEIKAEYDELIGRETSETFIYAVLKRNKWRMVMPRGKHPKKATEAEIDASKKLTMK